jgi:Ca-activated chloride channel family protein
MNQNSISSDDPRLTLYALDEMEPDERAAFERLLQTDAAARQAVEEIRAAGSLMAAALEHEPVEAGLADPYAEPKRGVLLRFPQLYYTLSGLAAACFVVFFIVWQSNYKPKEATRLIEVPLTAAKDAPAGQDAVAALEMPVAAAPAPMAVAPEGYGLKETAARAWAAKDEEGDRPGGGASSYIEAKGKPAARMTFGGPGSVTLGDAPASNTEAYGYHKDNGYLRVADQPLSTFSVDVDTASYANVRRFLQQGRRPPVDAVRIEELVNYFPYQYAPPSGGEPFAVALESAGAPWNPAHRLVRIGLKGREVTDASDSTGSPQARPPANLVFLLDVSGSMHQANKLPLVKQSLRLLVNKLRPDDRVAIAVYAGASGLALPSTSAARKAEILDAIDRLEASGSTNGAMGIQLAYDIAKANFITGGVNRVILATDGDFNVGLTNEGDLVRLVQEKAQSGVFLSVLGYGMGNLKDSTLEQLADKGNGHYAYIDSLAEARKSLVEQAGGTLVTIAKDVKIQVEFNPAVVSAYRLIGYENRLLAKEDFNNDAVDAGEIGAGHTVTALYEVVPVGVEMPATGSVDALKYQAVENRESRIQNQKPGEMLTVKIRYKEPAGDASSRLEFPLRDTGAEFAGASPDFKFAAAVAAFGMVLRDSPHKGASTLADVAAWGRAGLAGDAGGYRAEFLSLVERAVAVMQ